MKERKKASNQSCMNACMHEGKNVGLCVVRTDPYRRSFMHEVMHECTKALIARPAGKSQEPA